MDKTAHTPTPWHAVPDRVLGNSTRIGNGDFGCVADTGGCRPSVAENESNAAHIVRCVNAHDALIADNARLRAALQSLQAAVAKRNYFAVEGAFEQGGYANAALAQSHD